jgi:hypothetical protein
MKEGKIAFMSIILGYIRNVLKKGTERRLRRPSKWSN